MDKKDKPKVAEISEEMLHIHEQIRDNVEHNTSGAEIKLGHLKCSKIAAEHLFRLRAYKPLKSVEKKEVKEE